MTTMQEKLAAFERLLNIMDELRVKCPWDQKQTLESIRPLTIEETYELSDSIIEGDYPNIRKEIGDLLLHIVFYARIGSETGLFDITSVINSLNEKLIFRHPHVFKDVEVADDTEVKKNWEQLKIKEGNKSVLGGVPASLPSLIKASRIQEKVRAVGFDWEKREQVWDKVHEEMQEVMEEAEKGNQDGLEDEFGDLLFSVINAARLYNVDPDTALERTNQKFMKRFHQLEKEVNARGLDLHKMTLAQMDEIWEEAKKK
jgi:XTP/dITP diphosphohydrolase